MAQYEPLLREALRRRPAECDVLVISLGYDTLDGDPCAAEGHRLARKYVCMWKGITRYKTRTLHNSATPSLSHPRQTDRSKQTPTAHNGPPNTYHRLALQPADFGPMRRLLDEARLPLLVLQADKIR